MKLTPESTSPDCGHILPGSSGAARTADGRTVCCDCANAIELEALRTDPKFFGYLSSDGTRLTTWTGLDLGKVTKGALHPWSDRHSGRHYINVTDCHGARWHGTGAPGMWANLRRCKAAKI
jgi:hypothetical protein